MLLRPYSEKDKDSIITLIDEIYREYGDKICLERADSDLLDIDQSYGQESFCVLADTETIWGTIALTTRQENPPISILRRFYLHHKMRGTQWAPNMIQWARNLAQERHSARMEFWSDTRFDRAHAFYEKQGFERDGTVRTMNDAWEPYQEYFFFEEYPTA